MCLPQDNVAGSTQKEPRGDWEVDPPPMCWEVWTRYEHSSPILDVSLVCNDKTYHDADCWRLMDIGQLKYLVILDT